MSKDSPAAILFDVNAQRDAQVEEGASAARGALRTSDNEAIQLLLQILLELRVMNMHLAKLSDLPITTSDFEE